MISQEVMIPRGDVTKLLSAASPEATLLYIYIQSGNKAEEAESALKLSASRLSCAAATLRQLGLWPEESPRVLPSGERPNYTEYDVTDALQGDRSFASLRDELQRLMGRVLNTEELKIILGFVRYLGLSADVISVLVCYCRDRARQRGNLRSPSLRTIEKEAYAWAERGIDTMEEAVAFIRNQNMRHSRLGKLMDILQIRGRTLTAAEERYASSWLDMGFDEEAISMAYERTCLNTGGLNWNYMNKILQRWHQQDLHTGEAVRNGDHRPGGSRPGDRRQLDADEIAAIQRMMQEG